MSDFLEQVLKAPAVTRRASRGPTYGLSGSGRRYAVLLTLMAGMTAVPSWIILKAGVNGLGTSVAAPVQPLLAPASAQSRIEPDPAAAAPEPVVPRVPVPVLPPELPSQPQPVPSPLLERRSVVDTPDRPVRKKIRKPAAPPAPADPPATAAPQPGPSLSGPPSPAAPPFTGPPFTAPPFAEPTFTGPAPTFTGPTFAGPLVEPPAVLAPAVRAPSVMAPDVQQPSVVAPKVWRPAVVVPEVQVVAEIQVPSVLKSWD
ncbi:hypothetical protein Rhe02_96210 [Rhizocola hellebori]|uniref:Uncharacterized protein n=1 Tax=Rhizocola hellebori TaxID=1392758 RepID=A0A8J3QKP3_9ACTN|nr:hypothetical protein [Rhizocola hellebori]GIH11554.1 hypothetical protein Rhe02_96210 [Rhizocola hellebori]